MGRGRCVQLANANRRQLHQLRDVLIADRAEPCGDRLHELHVFHLGVVNLGEAQRMLQLPDAPVALLNRGLQLLDDGVLPALAEDEVFETAQRGVEHLVQVALLARWAPLEGQAVCSIVAVCGTELQSVPLVVHLAAELVPARDIAISEVVPCRTDLGRRVHEDGAAVQGLELRDHGPRLPRRSSCLEAPAVLQEAAALGARPAGGAPLQLAEAHPLLAAPEEPAVGALDAVVGAGGRDAQREAGAPGVQPRVSGHPAAGAPEHRPERLQQQTAQLAVVALREAEGPEVNGLGLQVDPLAAHGPLGALGNPQPLWAGTVQQQHARAVENPPGSHSRAALRNRKLAVKHVVKLHQLPGHPR
mmetsp:Transcript_44742/g.135639  ORF Transcript_44742/g.135639 Transcript_44742/m.135639 type:complete len:360 (+) Transcript_44742:650-1729(+)